LGRILDNLGKDFRAVASSVVGFSDSAEVYAVKVMNELNKNLEEELITKFRKLMPVQQQQVMDFVDFLIWSEQKRNSNLSGKSNMSEIKNDYQP